jgi:DNA-binding MarR family transcriptional regulator
MANGKPGRKADAKGRSSGDQFLAIPYVMARSAAFRSLSGSALKVWVEVRSRYDGTNNGRLTLSMDEAKRLLGMGKSTVARAIEELIAKGFIKVRKPGQWYGRLAR